MDAAQEAYTAAQRKIAEAAKNGIDKLYFDRDDFYALEELPEEITALTGLKQLRIESTKIDDFTLISNLKELERLHIINSNLQSLTILKKLTKLESLRLDHTQIFDLTPIVEFKNLKVLTLDKCFIEDITPLTSLINLKRLYLDFNDIVDISPLKSLTSLCSLTLEGTIVSDLRPLSKLKNLGSEGYPGLAFRHIPATALDARLAELADIEDHSYRARQTLAYLRSLPPWPEPYTPAATPDGSPPKQIGGVPDAPEQDPALPLIWGEKGFAFFAESIATDAVTEAALEDLRDLLDGLRRKGNAHDDLYRIAGELQERSAGDVSDLNMVKLHLSYQKLRRLHKGRAGRDHKFDDETVSQMEAVFDILPGVTLADDNVRTLIERQEVERAAGLTAQEDAASAKLLEDIQHPDAPFADEVKDVAAEVLKPGADDRLAGTRSVLSRNSVVAVFSFFSGSVVDGAIGGPVGNFLYNNGADLLAYAKTMGDDALLWAQSVFSKFRVEYELTMGITREVAGKPLRPKHKSKD